MTWVPDGQGGWIQTDPSDPTPRPVAPSPMGAPAPQATPAASSPAARRVAGLYAPTPPATEPRARASAAANIAQGLYGPTREMLAPQSVFVRPPPRPEPPRPEPPAPAAQPPAAASPPTGAGGEAGRLGTSRQAQVQATPLTDEEEALLARTRTLAERNGFALVSDDPQHLYALVEKKAGLKPGTVTWDYGRGSYVVSTGSGDPIVVADAKGNINGGGLELARSVGLTHEQSYADTITPEIDDREGAIGDRAQQRQQDAQRAVDEVVSGFDEAVGLDTRAADEARGYQRDVLDRQQAIINRILDFDPQAFAQMFTDQSLAALLAGARSARGGAGAVNSAVFAAQQQAPALFAQGQEQAAQLESQRLQAAGQVASDMGGLATNIRAGDENRSQFLADLGLRAQEGIASIIGVDMQLDAQATRDLGLFSVEFAKIFQQGQAMDLQQQLAQWDNLMRKYAVDEQARVALEQIRAQLEASKIGWDDVGLALLSVGGQVGAAYAGRK